MADYQTIPDPAEIFESTVEPTYITLEPYGQLTTTDEIRAVFGLSQVELPDEVLSQRVYSRAAYNSMTMLVPSLSNLWGEGEDTQNDLRPLVEDYVLYSIANQICDVLPILLARTISDSKATFQRFDTDLQTVIDSIRQRFALASKALAEGVETTSTPALIRPTLFGSGTPNYDPVTGEG